MAIEQIIDLMVIISQPNGAIVEAYIRGPYETVEECQADAHALNESVDNIRLKFGISYDCDVYKYEIVNLDELEG